MSWTVSLLWPFPSAPCDSSLAANQGVLHISSLGNVCPSSANHIPFEEWSEWTISVLMSIKGHLGVQLLGVRVLPPWDRICLRENPSSGLSAKSQRQNSDDVMEPPNTALPTGIISIPFFVFCGFFFNHEGESDSFNHKEQKDFGICKQKVSQENANVYCKTSTTSVVPLCLI